jgi:hypothetical protein
MKRIKTLLIFSLVIALSFSLFGCKLLPWGDSAVEETTTIAALPGWLTLAHRAEAAEEPEVEEEEEATEEEAAEAPAQTATTQPATTQPATTQPAQTEQPAQSSGTPLYMQPGTMEYLAKLQLDQAARDLKSLDARIASATSADAKELRAQRNAVIQTMYVIGAEIGLNIEKEYGIKPVSAGTNAAGDATWFHNWNESPSGFGD